MNQNSPTMSPFESSNYSRSDLFIGLGELTLWFDKRQAMLFTKGKEAKRDRQTEIILRRLSTRKKKGLLSVRYGNKLVYTLRKRGRNLDESTIYHGLACTETLIRFYLANREGEIIPEKFFKGRGLVPDGGIIYPNKTALFNETSTRSNVLFHKMIEGKLRAY